MLAGFSLGKGELRQHFDWPCGVEYGAGRSCALACRSPPHEPATAGLPEEASSGLTPQCRQHCHRCIAEPAAPIVV